MSERYYQGQKLQRIAVKDLLYRLQLPGTYESRMHSVHCSFNLFSARYHRVRSDRRKTGGYFDPIQLLEKGSRVNPTCILAGRPTGHK